MKKDKIFLGLLGGCSVLALAAPATAQDTSPDTLAVPTSTANAPTKTSASTSSSGNAAVEDIIVTGSRVIQNGNNSPTPVTIVTTNQLQQTTPSSIPDALKTLPVFSGSNGTTTFNNASSNNVGNYLNLRNVGAQRTLILFDGHRVGPTTQNGLVDTNTIPQLLLQRVDVETGGASAVYGSDAITGVVNFIVDKKFTGFKAQVQGGLSQKNDDGSQRAGVAYGTDLFGGRGHFEASYEYYNSEGVPTKLTRANGQTVYSEQGAGSAANPYHLITNTRFSNTSFLGLILPSSVAAQNKGNPFAGYVFNADGTLRPFVNGAASGTTNIQSGGDGAYYDKASLAASLRSHQVFARFDYDVTDNINAYAQVSGTESYNLTNYQNVEIRNFTISSSNAYLQPQYQAALLAAGDPTFRFSRTFNDTPPLVIDSTVKSLFAVVGLDGKLGSRLSWDLSYSRTEARQRVSTDNNLNEAHTAAALDAVKDNNGNIVCRVTLTNPGLYPGCVPINVFGASTLTPAMQNYILGRTTYRLKNNTDDVAGSISGSLFDDWAGPVNMALSGEYRHLTLDVVSNAHPTDFVNCTGLLYNCLSAANSKTPTVAWLSNVVSDARGRVQNITEGAFEIAVPLLKDFTLAQSLDFNGAVRYAHYDTSGNATTWKAGLVWRPINDLTIRATRSRDIRAPNLNDLFQPIAVNPAGFTDLHTGISDTENVITQGNPNLKPEKADTTIVGFVYKPSFIPRFSVAIDYYNIKIGNAIGTVSGQTTAVQQQCENSGGTDPYCALLVRPLPFSDHTAANFPIMVYSLPENIATLKTSGIDFELNYAMPLAGGDLTLRALTTYTAKLTTISIPGAIPTYQAGAAGYNTAGLPKIRVTAFIHYDHGPVSIDLQERWNSSTRQSSNHTLLYTDPRYPAAAYTDLTLSYMFKAGGNQAQMFFTVQNLLNRSPDPYAGAGGGSAVAGLFPSVSGGEDLIGRYFTGGVRFKF